MFRNLRACNDFERVISEQFDAKMKALEEQKRLFNNKYQ